jgi:hypothetical protein
MVAFVIARGPTDDCDGGFEGEGGAMSTDLRSARSTRTWPNGDHTEHLWVEVEPDGWLEVNRFPESSDEAAQFRADNQLDEPMKVGKTYTMRCATRFIQQFGDTFEYVHAAPSHPKEAR